GAGGCATGPPHSPDAGEDFPASALLLPLLARAQPRRGRDDRDAESAENARQVGRLGVDAQTGLRDAADAGDRTLAVLTELERDRQRLAGSVLVVLDVPAGDVALLLEDLGDVRLDPRVGHRHGVVVRRVRVTQTSEHVCNGVCHCHLAIRPFSPGFPYGPSA